ncbi:MAG: hypothetical protein ACRC3A_02995 [Culicoidibacterales bacterium]
MKQTSKFNWINWRAVVIANLVMLGFIVIVLPYMSQLSTTLIGSELSLDTGGVYTSAYIYEVAEIYGSEGRFYYTLIRYTFDLIWPLVYWFFLSVNIAVLLRIAPRLKRGFLLLLWVPTLALGFDLLENISITWIFWHYPETTAGIDVLAPWFSQFKWLCIGLSFLILCSLASYRLGQWLISKRKQA